MLRKVFDFFSHVADFFRDGDAPIFKKNTHLILRPDGTWVLDQKSSGATKSPKIIKQPTNSYYTPSISWSVLDEVGEILSPPDFFPHKDKLTDKLNKCLDMDVISSCVHIRTDKGTYILQVEVPCSEDYASSYTQFKTFVRAMEKHYEFKTIQEERILSKVTDGHTHFVVFEYDPRSKLF